uniref:Disease resistance R13L4/SHOC-2-like LRR domain-containing protein n=1 Tax=Cannabis sativa TaxID=3483 RepID=A0A803PYP6_CANSA
MWMLLQQPALAEAIGIREVLSRLKDQSQPPIVVDTDCLLVPLWHRGDLPSDLDFMPLLMAAISVCYLCTNDTTLEMRSVQYIDNDLCPGNLRSSFRCLESLRIQYLPNLEGFSRHEVGNEMFPSLSSLFVYDCPKLTLPKLGSIKSLTVCCVSQQLVESISSLHGLTKLEMAFSKLTSLLQNMLHNLTSLQELSISGFKKIQELPTDFLIGLNALKFLEIENCEELKCLPEGMFRDCSLRRIRIDNCENLRSLPECFQNLTMLNHLELSNCPAMEGFPSGPNQLISLQHLNIGGTYKASQRLVVLPEGLQHLCSLEYLEISYILELASLPDWLGNLTTLKELKIIECPDLECIPMSMQRLTNLKKLSIERCPKLEQKCEKEVGEDWHKISHIPHVDIRSDWW